MPFTRLLQPICFARFYSDQATTAMRPHQITVIGDEEGFSGIGSEWQSIAAAHRRACAFLSHAWADAAWQWRCDDARLRLGLIHHNQDPVAICPLISSRRVYHRVPVRTLEFLAVPDAQECDVLCKREHERDLVDGLARLLSRELRDWDIMILDNLRADALALQALPKALEAAGLGYKAAPVAENPCIPLTGSWSGYYAGRSRRLKKGNNLIANRLRRKYGEPRLVERRLASDNPDEIDAFVEEISAVSAGSWKAGETRTTFNYPPPQRFLRRLAQHANSQIRLCSWLLRLGDQVAASELQLWDDTTVFALRSDFREDFADDSPGTFLHWKLLERLFESPAHLYCMGPGENPYKSRWAVESLPLSRMVVFNNTPAGRICRLAASAAPLVEKVRDSLSGNSS